MSLIHHRNECPDYRHDRRPSSKKLAPFGGLQIRKGDIPFEVNVYPRRTDPDNSETEGNPEIRRWFGFHSRILLGFAISCLLAITAINRSSIPALFPSQRSVLAEQP